jgi:cell division protein FtsQ
VRSKTSEMARSLVAPHPRRIARRSAQPVFGALRPLTAAASLTLAGVGFARRRRRLRRGLVAALVALPLLCGGWLWLRDSPLVAVEQVRIGGVHGVDAGAIDGALSRAARRMTTLDVNVGALRAAVAPLRVVRDLRVDASFPHALRIDVIEQLPAAAMVVGGARTAVAADGVVLGPGLLSSSLPTIAASSQPLLSGRVKSATVLAELRVLGAAPAVLAGWIARVVTGPEGITVAMRTGLSIYFGDAARPHAKWLSAARVLADPSSAGATYLDVRLPERPAAGTTAAGGLEGATRTGQVSASDPATAALATALAEAVSGQSGAAGSSAAGAAASSTAGSSAAGAATSVQAGASSAPAQTPAGATSEPAGTQAPSASPAQGAAEEPSTSSSG